jgi:hypothetical protein
MKKNRSFIASVVTVGVVTLTTSCFAQAQVGSNRFEVQRHDLSVPGREVVQVVVTIGKGQTAQGIIPEKRLFMSSKDHWSIISKASTDDD